MTDSKTLDTEVQDLSLGVIHALSMIDVKVLSNVQLRRLNAALMHAGEAVGKETALRAENDKGGDTVRVPSRKIDQPR